MCVAVGPSLFKMTHAVQLVQWRVAVESSTEKVK